LEVNKIHYKCLTGLFDILLHKKDFAVFSCKPNSDGPGSSIGDHDEMVRYMCAALVVCGNSTRRGKKEISSDD